MMTTMIMVMVMIMKHFFPHNDNDNDIFIGLYNGHEMHSVMQIIVEAGETRRTKAE